MKPLALLLFAALAAAGANWADRGEYDLALAVRAELVPQKRVALLDQWKAKYPNSEYQQARRELYFAAWQAMGDNRHMLDTAAEIFAAQPAGPLGAYWLVVLLPGSGPAPPERLALGEKAAGALAAGPNQLLARRALAWIHWQRGELPAAEEELRKCLALDPARAETSAWLGTVLALEQQPEKQVPALWQLARAVSRKDAGALAEEQRRAMNTLLERLYTGYHGDSSGLDQLRAASAAAPNPPAGFTIESAADLALRKHEEALSRDNPRLADWFQMRHKLEAPDGDKYFAESLHNTPLPRLKGTLVQARPEEKPTELVIAVVDPAVGEIVLKLSAELPNPAVSGTPLEFEGVIDAFTRAPFNLTLLADPAKIVGWPAK